MYKLFVGCDVSSEKIDVSYSLEQRNIVYLSEYDNSTNGLEKLFSDLRNLSGFCYNEWFVCFENTGVYSKLLLHTLYSEGITCREENPLHMSRSLGLRHSKTDKLDSQAICTYCYEKRDVLLPSVPLSETGSKIKKLLSKRRMHERTRQALKNSQSGLQLAYNEDFVDFIKDTDSPVLKVVSEAISNIDKKIASIIKSDEGFSKNNILISSVIGIGPQTAAYILAYTDNFRLFDNSRKFASYVGIAPHANSSGKWVGRKRVAKHANKFIKAILSNGVASAIQHDPQLKQYYEKKAEKGKKNGRVLNALKNKLIHRVFATIKREKPYVKMATYE